MKSFFKVFKENISSIHLILRLSLFELKSRNRNLYLGMLWEILNPIFLISIYWFVFGFGIRGGKPVGDIDFLPWMLSGISMWFFTSQAIIQGSKSIYSRIKVISKMNFPLSVVPAYVITSKLYHHFLFMLLMIGILWFLGYPPTIYSVQIFYFIIANIILLASISLITSTLATIVRDIQMVVQAFVRVLLYISPILWSYENMPESVISVLKLNPFFYIVEGYRSSLLGISWFSIIDPYYTLYFWGFVFLMLVIGSTLHIKFQKSFVDYL